MTFQPSFSASFLSLSAIFRFMFFSGVPSSACAPPSTPPCPGSITIVTAVLSAAVSAACLVCNSNPAKRTTNMPTAIKSVFFSSIGTSLFHIYEAYPQFSTFNLIMRIQQICTFLFIIYYFDTFVLYYF